MKLRKIASNVTEITLANSVTLLFSYNTPVAVHIPGEGYYRTSKKWSVTTSKHITQWAGKKVTAEKDQSYFDALA